MRDVPVEPELRSIPRENRVGRLLPLQISSGLEARGIPHELYAPDHPMALKNAIELRVFWPGRTVEFQLTLREKVRPKIAHFLKAAMQTARVGPRVYLEIKTNRFSTRTHRRREQLSRRIVDVIRMICREDKMPLEPHDVIGYRLRIGRCRKSPDLTTFSLFKTAGKLAKFFIRREKKRQRRQAELLKERRDERKKRAMQHAAWLQSISASHPPRHSSRASISSPKRHATQHYPLRIPALRAA